MTDRYQNHSVSFRNGSSRNSNQGITEEDVRVTAVLASRPSRQSDLVAEVQSLQILAQQLVDAPKMMLKTLVGVVLNHCQAGTVGVSLLETASDGELVFRWVAIAGAFADLEQTTVPGDFSPCGTTLRTNQPQLYAYPERCFTYLHHPQLPIVEKLIIPLCVNHQPLGTLWLLSHDEVRLFNLEDQRFMTSLAGFAAAALQSIAPLGQQAAEDTLQQEQEAHTEPGERLREAHATRSQVALRQSEALNQQIFNSSDDCLKILDLSGRLLYMSSRGQELIGIEDLAVFLNRSWVEFWQGDDRQSALKALDSAKAGGVGSFQGYCPTLAGEPKWWDVKLTPVRGADGQIERLLCISRDITERKQIEAQRQQVETALRESEENFRAIFSVSSSGKAQADAKTRRLLRVNPALCQITGYSESELLTMTHDDLNHPEDRERDRNLYQDLVSRITDKYQSETRYIRKDGSIVWVNVIGNVIHDANGNPLRAVVVIQDISDRKRIEDERKCREANLAFLAEIADDFSRLSTADEIMQTVGAKIGAYLKITTCNFTDVNEARGEVTVHHGWNSMDVPSTVGTFRLREYLSEEFERASRAGETVVICNTQIDSRTQASGYAALNMHSFVAVPFHRRGRWAHYIAICDSRPRDWRDDEIELIEEISNRIFPRLERARAEAALRESEAKYRLLFESIDEGFCICEMLFAENGEPIDYRFLEVNPVFEMLTGLENVVGKTARELVPDLETYWFKLYGSVVQTGEPIRFEQRSIAMNRWFDVNAFCVGETHSHKFAILFTNITERKKAEQERERFLAVGSDFLVITGIDRYFHWVSPSFERLLGWTADEMTSRAWTEFVHPDDINSSVAEIDSLFSGDETCTFENRYRHKDGSYRWLLWNAQSYPDEQVVYGAAVDITDRKQAEAAIAADLRDTQLLRDLSARFTTEAYSQVLYGEIVTTAIALMRSDAGSFQVLDPATQELLLLATQGFGPSMAGHFDRVDTSFNTSCAIALATGERAFVDFDVPESDDPKGYRRMHVESGLLSAQSTPLISRSGKLIGMVSTHWRTHHRPTERELRFLDLLARQAADLLEQRQAEVQRRHLLAQEQAAREEAEQANRVKDEFLTVLSHELRTPLNPILGWSTLLLNKKLDEAKTAHALTTIQRNAKLQSELIEDLLDVSRILSGKLSLNVTSVNLVATILGAIETVRLAAEAKSIKVETSLAPDIGLVAGDSTRLQQVIWNLLLNGVKFTPPGGQISIRLERFNSYAHITVSDTGRGIAPDFLPYIFDHFRQADGSTTRQFGGLGLGLAIVRYLVELHGGTVRAESPGEGQGATFIVRLPVMLTPPEANQDEQSPE